MMLGNMVAEKPEPVVRLRYLEPFFKKLPKRNLGPVHVIENPEFHCTPLADVSVSLDDVERVGLPGYF